MKFSELKKMNNFKNLKYAKELSKKNFWHYTSVNRAYSILQNKYFVIGSIENMNDVDEAQLHKNDGHSIYALCLCNSDTENIPLWYLYSGINGNGVRIGITPKNMLSFIKNLEVRVFDEKQKECVEKMKLLKREDYEVYCGFIYYVENKKVKFRNKFYHIERNENNYFTKKYPWNYENEFRIVIKLKKQKRKYDKLVLSFNDEFAKNIKIMSGPECDIKKIHDYFKTKASKSELNISMGLLNKNIKEIKNMIVDKVNADENLDAYNKEHINKIINNCINK